MQDTTVRKRRPRWERGWERNGVDCHSMNPLLAEKGHCCLNPMLIVPIRPGTLLWRHLFQAIEDIPTAWRPQGILARCL